MSSWFNDDADVRRVALRTPSGFLAFGFGSGLVRWAPGTFGTLAAVPFALLLHAVPLPLRLGLLTAAFAAGVGLCGRASRRLGQHDPGGIVWDEMVAYCLVLSWLPLHWGWWLAAFVLFRAFDILKPWPIRRFEQALGGGLGIMFDDLVAAAYASLCLAALLRLA